MKWVGREKRHVGWTVYTATERKNGIKGSFHPKNRRVGGLVRETGRFRGEKQEKERRLGIETEKTIKKGFLRNILRKICRNCVKPIQTQGGGREKTKSA